MNHLRNLTKMVTGYQFRGLTKLILKAYTHLTVSKMETVDTRLFSCFHFGNNCNNSNPLNLCKSIGGIAADTFRRYGEEFSRFLDDFSRFLADF